MDKYKAIFSISLQQELYNRASFIMDRARSITILIAFYAFWSAVFQGRASLLGYTQSQMFTYILGMNVLRALVFSDKTWEIIREINTGKISSYLLRPISYIGYSLSRDVADKAIHLLSSIVEVSAAVWLLRMPLYRPHSGATLALFAAATLGAMALYFFMSYAVSALAFWTAESAGPRFCFELFLEFASGAFFPLDVLPGPLRHAFEALPFATVLYFPLNVFLERASPAAIARGFAMQGIWIAALFLATRWIWRKGLRVYSAEGG